MLVLRGLSGRLRLPDESRRVTALILALHPSFASFSSNAVSYSSSNIIVKAQRQNQLHFLQPQPQQKAVLVVESKSPPQDLSHKIEILMKKYEELISSPQEIYSKPAEEAPKELRSLIGLLALQELSPEARLLHVQRF